VLQKAIELNMNAPRQMRTGAAGLELACHGEVPWYLAARNPKRLPRAVTQRLIERIIAFADHWDVDALAPNLVVALRHRR
jgi:hypothetical protein